jgi:hypothetical protein
MSTIAIIGIILIVLGLTVVFYAAHSPRPLNVKTIIAAVGFLVLAIALYVIGALGH